MSESVSVPQGDPVYAVYTWRRDSISLARIRPLIEEVVAMADEPCLRWEPLTCLSKAEPKPCVTCRLKLVRARLYRTRQTQPEPT